MTTVLALSEMSPLESMIPWKAALEATAMSLLATQKTFFAWTPPERLTFPEDEQEMDPLKRRVSSRSPSEKGRTNLVRKMKTSLAPPTRVISLKVMSEVDL